MCIFCKIVAGEIPCHRLHDDDHVLAFLDVSPLRSGHALVIPKGHHQFLEDLPAAAAAALVTATQRVSGAIRQVTGAPATTVAVHNGPEAGQEVPHCHVHIVPRVSGDGGGPIHALFSGASAAGDLAAQAEALRGALGS